MTTADATRSPDRLRQSVAPFLAFFSGPFSRLNLEPDVANFAVGNPQEMPLPAYVEALRRAVVPHDKDWFAYTMARAPIDDDVAFGEILARHRVLVLPGTIVEVPGWFRISLTASDDMVGVAIPRFAAALAEVRG